MAKTSLNAAHHFRGNYGQQNSFLKNVRDWYYDLRAEVRKSLTFGLVSVPGRQRLELLHGQYRRGVLNGWLACPYYEFEDYVLRGLVWRADTPRRVRRWRDDGHGLYFRDGNKYRKDTAHEKKADKPDPRLDWREKKGFTRDKRRHGYWFSGSRCRAEAKTLQSRRRRHGDKRRIRRGEWEGFPNPKPDRSLWD